MNHSLRHLARSAAPAALAALAALAGCGKPDVSPGLDVQCRPDNLACQPGSITGNVTYQGTRRGDVVLLLFATNALPPPDGLGTTAQAISKVVRAKMFGSPESAGQGPFGAQYVFSQVPPGHYQIRAFIDASGLFFPFFDFSQQPHAGDPVGGHVDFDSNGVPHLAAIDVPAGTALQGVSVAIGQETPNDPPSFTIVEAPQGSFTLPQSMDRPVFFHVATANLGAANASFANAHFGVELRPDASGLPSIPDGDGFYDVYPQVLLEQTSNADGTALVIPAVIPVKVNPLPLLPLLFQQLGKGPVPVDNLELAVLPFAGELAPPPTPGGRPVFTQSPSIPAGNYRLVVIEKSGQVWTLPNSLGATLPSQAVQFAVATATLAPGGIKGTVRYQGPATPGNITVQAYLADPANPPPPLGTQLPVRVKVLRVSQVTADASGFSAPYEIDGLPAGTYLVQVLNDGDGNFAPFTLLQTPTRGDVVGGHLTGTGQLAPVAVTNAVVDGVDCQLVQVPGQDAQGNGVALDPPAFAVDQSKGQAVLAQDARGTIRISLQAQPISFPIGAGQAATTRFTVALVRDANGNTVDSDADGLPDVWPRVFIVKLDDSDPTGLTQATPTVVIPAAVDPTPWMPRLLANPAPVLASRISVVVRPAALDVSNPDARVRLPVIPAGRYKIVVLNETGQAWQVPNDSGPDALDPRAAALSPSTASQSKGFTVVPPTGPVPVGSISGLLRVLVPGPFLGAWVFAYDASSPPPPLGTGTPVSADFHVQAEQAADGTIPYTLRGLTPGHSYLVTTLVDTRGDFALDPQIFAAAPGQGSLAGGHLDATNTRLDAVAVGATPVTGIDVIAGQVLPPRPSFVLTQGGVGVTTDVVNPFADAITPERLTLHAQTLLTPAVGGKPESTPAFFPVSFRSCDPANPKLGLDTDFDNLPDLYPRILVVKLLDADPTGLTLDPQTTIIPAAIDPTSFFAQLGDCNALPAPKTVAATDLSVILSPVAVQPQADHSLLQVPIPAGRYGVVLLSKTGQVWQIPNVLQPALLDASVSPATAQSLQTQGVALRVTAQVPASLGGGIRGAIHVAGTYGAAGLGNILVAAYSASAPPPPLGLGRPVAVQVIPKPIAQAFIGSQIPYQLSNLPPGAYLVAALNDPLGRTSPSLSFLSTPGLGAQVSFSGGAAPAPIVVGSTIASGADVFLDPVAVPTVPFERPMFTVDTSTSALSVRSGAAPGTFALVALLPTVPSGLPFAVSTAAFHPVVARCGASGRQAQDPSQSCTPGAPYQDMNVTCGAGGHPWISTQVYASPIDTGARFLALVKIDACQFCPALTGTPLCTAAPLQPPNGPLPMAGFTVAVTNVAIDPLTGGAAGVALPTGHYALTVVEPTGLLWTIPNELAAAGGASGAGQSIAFTVAP